MVCVPTVRCLLKPGPNTSCKSTAEARVKGHGPLRKSEQDSQLWDVIFSQNDTHGINQPPLTLAKRDGKDEHVLADQMTTHTANTWQEVT